MATILGTSGADQLGATGMTSTADRISAGAGNDTLVYDLATAGGADTYYGGTGVDTLELNLTSAEWATHRVKVLALQKAVNDATKTASGSVAAGTNFGKLDFGNGKTLQVYEVETVKIYIDGNLYTGDVVVVNKPVSITSDAQVGDVTEDDILSASGAVEFVDADLADVHLASFVAASGQTALGEFVLDTVNEDSETADGMVSWSYNLDNSSAAVQALAAGQTVTEKYTVSVTDSKGSVVSQVVTITIKGATESSPVTVTNEGEVVEAGIDEEGKAVSGPATASGKLANAEAPASAVWSVVSGEGTYGTLAVKNGVWTYTLDNTSEATGALVFGQSEVEKFIAQASFKDENGDEQIVEQEIAVTVFGTNDKAAIAIDGEQDLSVVEATNTDAEVSDAFASGVLVVADADAEEAFFEAGTVVGTYGDLTISADGIWNYILRDEDANVQALKGGEKVEDKLIVRSLDGSASYAITVAVTGSEDSGSITIDEEFVNNDLTVAEAGGIKNADAGDLGEITLLSEEKVQVNASGKFTLSDDPDSGSAGFKALTTAAPVSVYTLNEDGEQVDVNEDGEVTSADTHLETAPGSSKGLYGDFTLDTKTGEWTYKLREADADKLAEGQEATDKLVVYSADGLVSSTITVTITGKDDAATSIKGTPVDAITKEVDQAAMEADPENYAKDVDANGTLEAVDPDGGDAPDAFETVLEKSVQAYGEFTLLDNGDGTASWSYALDEDKAEALKGGETKTEKLVVVSGGASHVVTVAVKGSDDAAAFVAGEEDDTEVVEAGGNNNEVNAEDSASGVITVADADAGQSSWSAASLGTKKGASGYGSFKLELAKDEDGKAIADQLTWTYTLDNKVDKVQKLQAGDEVTDTIEVTSADGSKHTITVDVFGANDEAKISVIGTADVAVKEAGGANNKTAGDAKAAGQLKVVDPDDTTVSEFDGVQFKTGSSFDADENAADFAKTTFESLVPTGLESKALADGKVQGTFGSFTFDAVSGKWAYTLDDTRTATQQLDANQKAVDSLVVYSADSSDSYQINVNITGAGDNASVSNLTEDTAVNAGGWTAYVADNTKTEEDEEVLPEEIAADTSASGSIAGVDPDAGAPGDDPSDSATPLTFSTLAASALKGKYGDFTFISSGEGAGDWTYTLNEADADTLALKTGDKVQDKLTVKETNGSLYTISVDVKGANDKVTLVEGGEAKIDAAGKVTFTVADGDTGKLSLLIGADAETAKAYAAATVLDGKVSTFTAPTTAGTTVTQGLMFVSDSTKGHDFVELGAFVGLGTNAANTLSAVEKGDTAGAALFGYGGNDALTGADNNDYLNGGSGNDTVDGGAGADILDGGTGNDVLTGGDGSDVFVFRTTAAMGTTNADAITDFMSGEDTLQVGMALLPSAFYKLVDGEVTAAKAFADQAGTVAKGAETSAWFREDLKVSSAGKVQGTLTAEDRFVYDSSTGTLWYDNDGKATTAAVKVAVLGAETALTADDFQFV